MVTLCTFGSLGLRGLVVALIGASDSGVEYRKYKYY